MKISIANRYGMEVKHNLPDMAFHQDKKYSLLLQQKPEDGPLFLTQTELIILHNLLKAFMKLEFPGEVK